MRRWLAVAPVAAALLLAACTSLPPGVDGDLVDDWAPLAAPTGVVPVGGDCYGADLANMLANPPVACTQPHLIEVSYVGIFTGTVGAGVTPPVNGSTARSDAFAQCAAPTEAYLGADWRAGLDSLSLTVPDAAAWSAGARWFRCDLRRLDSPEGNTTNADTPLKGALVQPGPLSLRCVGWTDHKSFVDNIHSTSCATPHNGEYAGFFVLSAQPFPSSHETQKALEDAGCQKVIEQYLGLKLPYDSNASVGWLYPYLDEDQWNSGDRSVRCYAAAYTRSRRFIGSVKGIGNRTAKG